MDKVQETTETQGEVNPPAASEAPKSPAASADKPAKAARPPAVSSAGAKTKTVESDSPPDPVNKMRRRTIWTFVGGFLAVNFMMFLKFFFPRTLYEPSTVFRVGYPADFGFGVDTKFQQDYRVWVVRNAEKLFVIFARCTHLGCTPDWKPSENKFKCPCHGSGYTNEGINFEGPAPRPMDRAHIELDASGQIVVDTSQLYSAPKGERSKFNDDGAFIRV